MDENPAQAARPGSEDSPKTRSRIRREAVVLNKAEKQQAELDRRQKRSGVYQNG